MLENNRSMDQAKYWIWSKRRWINPRAQPSFFASPYATHHESSWEEQAFAEDTLHIWPPRSYSCSFCWREFRSAQALGGHMNVHRRDRAKLRQQPSSPTTEDHEQYNSFAQLEEDVSNPNYVISAYNFYSPPQNQVFLLGPDSNIGDGNSKRKNCSFDDCQEVISRKRQYVDPEFHLFVRAKSPGEVQKLQREVTTLNPSYPIEEIDLELRLGNSPKVN